MAISNNIDLPERLLPKAGEGGREGGIGFDRESAEATVGLRGVWRSDGSLQRSKAEQLGGQTHTRSQVVLGSDRFVCFILP